MSIFDKYPTYPETPGSPVNPPTLNQSLNGTGVIRGGIISVQSGTELFITEGFGYIVDTLDPDGNRVTRIDWADTFYNPTLTTDGLFILICDDTGTFSQISNENYDAATRRDFLTFGAFTIDGGVLVSATPFVVSGNEPLQQLFDLLSCLGTIRCSGLSVSAAATDLTVALSSGVIHAAGAGSQNAGRAQNVTSINGQTPMVFRALLGKTESIVATGITNIDPASYDNGSGAPVAITGSGKATIQYVFLLPSPNVEVTVMYGQTVYNSLADAVAAGAEDPITVPDLYARNALLLGRIAVSQSATDLSDQASARFLAGARFGSGLAGGSAAGGGGGGDVIGAASSVVNEVLVAADASGKVLKNSGVTVSGEQIFNSSGKNISRAKTSTVRLYRSSAFNLPAGSGLGGVNFDGFENAVADGANITPNLSGSIYGVPSSGLYRVTIEFWVRRESGAASSHVDVLMSRAGFSDISDRANVVGTRVVFDNNQIPQQVSLSRTIRLTTAQTMQLRIGNNFDPISILCSAINPLTVSYDRIDD